MSVSLELECWGMEALGGAPDHTGTVPQAEHQATYMVRCSPLVGVLVCRWENHL